MKGIDSKKLAGGALKLTLAYLSLWLIGPALLPDSGMTLGLPHWFWWSCIVTPLLLCVAVGYWLRVSND